MKENPPPCIKVTLKENEEDGLISVTLSDVDDDLGILPLLRKYAFSELKHLVLLTWPVLLTNMSYILMDNITLIFVGHLSKDELAATALAESYLVMLQFIAMGLVSGLSTLVSQTHGVDPNSSVKLLVLKRSFLIVTLCCIPLIVLLQFCAEILIVLKQTKSVSKLAGRYTRYSSIGLIPICYFTILKEYLIAQSYMIYPMLCTFVGVAISIISNLILVKGYNNSHTLGYIGAAVSAVLSRVAMLLVAIPFVVYLEIEQYKLRQEQMKVNAESNEFIVSINSSLNDTEIEFEALQQHRKEKQRVNCGLFRWFLEIIEPRGMFEYLKIAVPGTIQLCLEVYSVEITTFIVGYLHDETALAASSILAGVSIFSYYIPLSISSSCSARIGHCLGSQQHAKAKVCSLLAILMSGAIMVANAALMAGLRHQIGRIYTKDPDVLKQVSFLLPIVSAFLVLDGIQTTQGGILIGIGRQLFGAISYFLSYLIFNIPLGVVLAFVVKLKLFGIWIGIGVGNVVSFVVFTFYMIFLLNFKNEVQNALNRVEKSGTNTNHVASPVVDNGLDAESSSAATVTVVVTFDVE
jgi:MATE family multidrug resistance protein